MTHRPPFDLPFPEPTVIPPASPLPPAHDTSLFLTASARWSESIQGLRQLAKASPGVRDTLNQLLKKELDLDGEQAGLLFAAKDEHPERFVSFTDACAFVLQHPTLETTLDQQCRVTGLSQAHPLSTLTPLQMLQRLKTLNPEQAHGERWLTFWDSRAPGTAVSRQERVKQLYRNHFEAAAQLALAQKTLTADQLKPLQLIIDPPNGALALNDQPINTEQLALVLSNQARVKLTGAWVITLGDAASASQLLYLPSRPVAIQVFSQRSDMQDWLSKQGLVPTGLPSDNVRVEYTAKTDPLFVGASELFAAHQQSQITALRYATRGKHGLAEHGAQSLVQADQVDKQRSNAIVFASPPRLEAADGDAETDAPSLFGNLYADIPLSSRQAALTTQRNALETLVKEVGEGEGLQPFKDSLKALETAEEAADKAASGLLNRSRTLDIVIFQQEFTALHSAHAAGLGAEAALQLALKQLNDDECGLLKSLLDTPHAPGPDAVAASLTLSMTEQDGDTSTVTVQELKGALIMTHADALADADSPHSVLLYWLGTGGGLQRFANRRELEHQLFKVHDRSEGLSVQLKKITGDALLYGLNQLTSDFEEQAGAIRQRHADPGEAAQRAEQLDILRKRTLATLQVPVHAARSLAAAHLLEQDRSATLASNLPDWLGKLTVADRTQLKNLIEAYIAAMHRSHKIMTVALEPRDDFTRKHLNTRLGKDFSIKGSFEVKLDLPDSVKWQKQLDPAAGHSGYVNVLIPSTTRSKMSLEELAQLNIDNTPSMNLEPLSLRLGFMQVEVTATDESERQTLTTGITRAYLKRILPELDLPKVYEQLIRDTFMGTATESVFAREHRRESLVEPWGLMLKLQGEFARLQRQIDQNELQILNIAIAANTPDAWCVDGKRIVLLPAYLSPGGEDTPNKGPVTLSGVTFIEEQISGITLLYLPDSPDGQFLHHYNSLEAARKGLVNLCLHEKWVSYIASRALQGSVRAHESRINQAMLKHFDAFIGVGERWPATTSLAAHLLNAHMGRLIEAHRGTSRSNDALYMERYALKGPRAFNYIKMAMGMLPFIGSAFALYDAWTSANLAVAAFLRGEVGDGLAEIESVLLSLIDAAMDLLPGEAAFSVGTRLARSLTRARQLHRLARQVAAMHGSSQRQARHVVARFAGYEYEKPISLSGLQPATHGKYRGIYRHVDGDFIVRQGRIFLVELSKDSHNWRLSGNSRKTYKQPIAQDETGHWDTWYGVHGTTFEGGGLGGGQVLGQLADTLDPLWPLVIRDRLPNWWTQRRLRRMGQLRVTADDLGRRYNVQLRQTDAAMKEFHKTKNAYQLARRQNADSNAALEPLSEVQQTELSKLAQAAETECIRDIELAIPRYEAVDELHKLAEGNTKTKAALARSECAWLAADRFKLRAHFTNERIDSLTDQANNLIRKLEDLPEGLDGYLSVMEDLRKARVKIVNEVDQIEEFIDKADQWFPLITRPTKHTPPTKVETSYTNLRKDIELFKSMRNDVADFIRTEHLLEITKRVGTTDNRSWLDLQKQTKSLRKMMYETLTNHQNLAEVSVTREQRNQILQACLDVYTQYHKGLRGWSTSYPQYFHPEAIEPLLISVKKLAERARKGIGKAKPEKPTGTITKKIFTSEDDRLLIGEQWLSATQTQQYVITGPGGSRQVWEQVSNGKFRLLNPSDELPAPTHTDLATLVSDARQRLDDLPAHQARVQGYARPDSPPVDLEDMMTFEADVLTRSALRIEELDAANPIIQLLRNKAAEHKTMGRQMRTTQSLASKKPTDGMLDDLIGQEAVEIHKSAPIKNLSKPKKRADYMQEYEVWDLTQTPPALLWYAHFHYSKAAPVFGEFEKAHLKLREHRFQTHADDADLPYADIGRQSAVLPHFAKL